jgi:hypothetical protein
MIVKSSETVAAHISNGAWLVYVDACVLKDGIQSVTRAVPVPNAGIYRIADIHTRDRIKEKPGQEAKLRELDSLPKIAELAKMGKIVLICQFEMIQELLGTVTIGPRKSCFDDVEIVEVEAPIQYSRFLTGPNQNAADIQYNFMCQIKNKRFQELQKATGAFQGNNALNRNQLADAFHIWCAEFNQAEYFLTMDFKLINITNSQKTNKPKVKVVRPTTLIEEIANAA